MNDQRTSYGAKDKHSSVQRICIYTATTYLVRKNWASTPSTTAGWQASRQNTAGF